MKKVAAARGLTMIELDHEVGVLPPFTQVFFRTRRIYV